MAEVYNYDTFRRNMMKEHMHFPGGPGPGEVAPDFDLVTIDGSRFHLSEWRGERPVLIEVGSITCPMTARARRPLANLHHDFGRDVEFVSVYVREAHPGEKYSHNTSEEQKLRAARDWG